MKFANSRKFLPRNSLFLTHPFAKKKFFPRKFPYAKIFSLKPLLPTFVPCGISRNDTKWSLMYFYWNNWWRNDKHKLAKKERLNCSWIDYRWNFIVTFVSFWSVIDRHSLETMMVCFLIHIRKSVALDLFILAFVQKVGTI